MSGSLREAVILVNSNPDLPARTPSGETALPAHQDGDIELGSQVVPDEHGRRPLTMYWEIKVAAGRHGKRVAQEQAAAIRDVLAWVTQQRSRHGQPGASPRQS